MKRATIILTITALLIALLPSCNKTESGKDKELTNVNIVFNVDGMQTKAETTPATTNEGIKTLRIIILDWSDDRESFEIIRNEKRVYTEEITTSKTLKIYDIPVGMYSFYFIANEESLNVTYTDDFIKLNLKPTDVGGVSKPKLQFVDEGNKIIPIDATNITEKGLPLSGYLMKVDVNKEMEPIKINMVHDVVKVVMTITNSTTTDLNISNMQFGPFISDRIYLFGEGNIDVPGDAEHNKYNHTTNIPLPAYGGKEVYTFYMFPTYAGSGKYTIGMTGLSNNGEQYNYEPQELINVSLSQPQPLAFVSRNYQLNINASIATLTDINISFKVTDWKSEDIVVPPFN